MFKELIQYNIPSTRKNLIKKWTDNLNTYFSKKDILMINRYMKGCSTSLIIREMKIKMRYHLTPVRMAVIQVVINNGCY